MDPLIPVPVAALALALALAVDATLGEPRDALHPVAWFGTVARHAFARVPSEGRAVQALAGGLLALALPFGATLAVNRAVAFAGGVHPLAGFALTVFALKSSFACRALVQAGESVRRSVDGGATDDARAGLSALCSRDASSLDATALRTSAIESLAENTSDSVVAPLLAYVCFGLEGAVAYRCINTLDAMYGYRDHREWLGKAAARLDDLANLVPARLTAALVLLAGMLLRLDVAAGMRVLVRDHGLTPSPNAGYPMSAAAGLLGVRLDKPGGYALGAELAPATDASLRTAARLTITTSALASLLALAATWCRHAA